MDWNIGSSTICNHVILWRVISISVLQRMNSMKFQKAVISAFDDLESLTHWPKYAIFLPQSYRQMAALISVAINIPILRRQSTWIDVYPTSIQTFPVGSMGYRYWSQALCHLGYVRVYQCNQALVLTALLSRQVNVCIITIWWWCDSADCKW